MALALWAWLRFAPSDVWLQGLVGMVIGVSVYALCAYGLRITEFWESLRLLRRE